ncbi:molybdopterin cofactor-binding domain-containing protein, partial [Alteromonas sp. 14N.309.X.WAT.G.H12]|uniref:molybdopterin cofactor-binding domain-containing protein n=1 Tax=Alteromonas sp. 14N.309.X.WAT.G.H12 TaxID=3120824 RepID=UPI002FD54F13
SVFINVETDGTVNIICHRSEMGQQIRTSIAQIIADELDADWQRISVTQATGDKKYGDQNTDGSRSIRRNIDRLQIAGATAALMLKQAAAKGWGISVQDCECKNHTVVNKNTGKAIDFAPLVPVAASMPVPAPETVTPKSRSAWKFVGKGVASLDLPAVVKGATVFGQDVQLDDMLVAVIVRPPVLYTSVISVDDTKAKQVAGVKHVITMPALTEPALFKPLGGVAVLATNTWAAMQGAKALSITWSENDNSQYQFETEKAALIASAKAGGEIIRTKGDAPSVIEAADEVIEATYFSPLLAQAPMEPPAATARVIGDKAEIWACTQNPQAAKSNVAGMLKIPEENVTVHIT